MYLTPLGLMLKNAPGVFVVVLNKRRAKLLHPAHAPDLHPCRPSRPARASQARRHTVRPWTKVMLFQSQPEGLGLFLRPPALYEIHPCISPLRGQQSCSNEFQTNLSITYVERLHCVLSTLSDTKIASSRGGYERSTSPNNIIR
jgi:hypothetical protein